MDLSVVIPCYNEANRLPQTLLTINEVLENLAISYEIIVVDDGSTDNTSDVALEFPKIARKLNLIKLDVNRGKGHAVREGIFAAQGNMVIFDDADGATPFEELTKLYPHLLDGADIAIASRALKGAQVNDLLYRKLMGLTFNALIRVLVLPDFKDTQCGFKLFKTDVARRLFQKMTLPGFCFDVEILYLAKKFGYTVVEVPIRWNYVGGSKVNPVKDAFLMFKDALKIRLNDLRGLYDA